MGYGITPYSINIEKLDEYYGSGNTSMIEKILSATKARLEDLDNSFNVEDGWVKAENIMSDFLMGNLQKPNGNPAKHWYVLEILIEGFGKRLNNGAWYPAKISKLYDYDEFRMYFVSKEGKFKIPTPDDFPVLFTIENKNLNIALDHISSDFEDREQIAEFEEWVNDAKSNNRDLVLYYF